MNFTMTLREATDYVLGPHATLMEKMDLFEQLVELGAAGRLRARGIEVRNAVEEHAVDVLPSSWEGKTIDIGAFAQHGRCDLMEFFSARRKPALKNVCFDRREMKPLRWRRRALLARRGFKRFLGLKTEEGPHFDPAQAFKDVFHHFWGAQAARKAYIDRHGEEEFKKSFPLPARVKLKGVYISADKPALDFRDTVIVESKP